MIVTAAELAPTCPSWCTLDHDREPADRHHGRLDVLTDVDLFLYVGPSGPNVKLCGPDGEVDLNAPDAARLAGVLTRFTAALLAAAN
jgi:hypothetical protein